MNNSNIINSNLEKVIVIVGPTAIGKTNISLDLCKKFNGEVINCDASQMKKDLNIGTAKIDLTKTDVVHHLIDIIECNDTFSCADFQKEARKLIRDINSRSKIPFIVGGTGLYVSSVIYDYDLSPIAKASNHDTYDHLTNEELHALLTKIDKESADKIHMNNRIRVIRAIECAKNGYKISSNNGKKNKVYDALLICLTTDREILYQRINKRVDLMIEEGFIDECKSLIKKGIDISKLPDIGYKHINSYLIGELSFENALDEIKKDTRHYAKRQMTWFRNQMDCVFIDMNYNNPNITFEKVSMIIDEYLKK